MRYDANEIMDVVLYKSKKLKTQFPIDWAAIESFFDVRLWRRIFEWPTDALLWGILCCFPTGTAGIFELELS